MTLVLRGIDSSFVGLYLATAEADLIPATCLAPALRIITVIDSVAFTSGRYHDPAMV